MLYKKNLHKTLADETFLSPTSEYRGTPFWAWNCKLDAELLKKEIEYLKEMGFGGFHMHPRVGLATEYLSDEFMHCIEECVEKAKSENMLAWLYDEDKWPSGYAGGINTKDVENRAKTLLFTKVPFDDGSLSVKEDLEIASKDLHEPKYYFEACYDVELDDEGYLVSFKKIDISAVRVRAYIYDKLVCVGTPETIISNLNSGGLQKVLFELYSQGVERGTITVGADGSCAFSAATDDHGEE